VQPTNTPVVTQTIAPTPTPTPVVTQTIAPTVKPTPLVTQTVAPTPTPTSTPTPTIVPTETPEPTLTIDRDLIIASGTKKNKDANGLLVSLRSDVNKANKNFYMLDEEITYYIDFMNTGKDISDKVEITLKIPLKFEIVDKDGGVVNNTRKTVTWTFKDGLEQKTSSTKIVTLRYTTLSTNSMHDEIVYPNATI
jgi:hypothetical protein